MLIIKEYINNNKKKQYLQKILEERKCPELLWFIEEVDSLINEKDPDVRDKMIVAIYFKYITSCSKNQINLSGEQYTYITNSMFSETIGVNIYDDAYKSVVAMITEHISDIKPKRNFFTNLKNRVYSNSFSYYDSKKEYKKIETKKSAFF
jgi:hypothetical protein